MSKRFYLIYKITNNLNNKFYIGKHETNNLDDNYFGSGKALNEAIKKYGLENFTKTILFYCQNRKEMNLLEQCVVSLDFIKRHDVYNMCQGGEGGDTWKCVGRKHSKTTKEYLKYLRRLRCRSKKEYIKISREEKSRRISNGLKRYYDKVGRKNPIKNPMPYKSKNACGKMVKVFLNNEEHTIYECDLQWYIDNGWKRGRNPTNKKALALTEVARNASSGKGKR